MPTAPIAHLYFFDDLAHHLRRICHGRQLGAQETDELLRTAADHVYQAMSCLDPARQDAVTVTWDHACTQLAWDLHRHGHTFDLVVAQGCNGDHALDSLLAEFTGAYGRPLAAARANVRSTHVLTDPDDAFHSDFRIDVSSGPPLPEQCRAAVERIPEDRRDGGRLRIAVLDDCIQTGRGTLAVAEQLLAALPPGQDASVHTLGFIACQATQERFADRGWQPAQGVLLRGRTYPESWDVDIYFLKDLVLDNAIRYADGSSQAYADNAAWIEKIFARDPAGAARALHELRAALADGGVYQDLLDL